MSQVALVGGQHQAPAGDGIFEYGDCGEKAGMGGKQEKWGRTGREDRGGAEWMGKPEETGCRVPGHSPQAFPTEEGGEKFPQIHLSNPSQSHQSHEEKRHCLQEKFKTKHVIEVS